LSSSVIGFKNLLEIFCKLTREMVVRDLLEKIIDQTKYIEWIDEDTAESQSRIENIKELLSVAAKFDQLEPKDSLKQFLEEVSLVQNQEMSTKPGDEQGASVTLMTLHSAKGLEFDNVFIVGMEEGLFPHVNSFTDPDQLEEERRLCYVGITRARKKLFLTHADRRFLFGRSSANIPSRFLGDLPEKLLERHSWNGEGVAVDVVGKSDEGKMVGNEVKYGESFKIGDVVEHEMFGQGKVLEVDDPYITVNFPGHGTKKLSLDFVMLEKVDPTSVSE